MDIQIVVTIGFLVAVFCLSKFMNIMKVERSRLSTDEMQKIDRHTDVSFLSLLIPALPVIASYFIQDFVSINGLWVLAIAGSLSVMIICVQQTRMVKKYRKNGVPEHYISAYTKGSIYLWVGMITFIVTYVLTKAGLVS